MFLHEHGGWGKKSPFLLGECDSRAAGNQFPRLLEELAMVRENENYQGSRNKSERSNSVHIV